MHDPMIKFSKQELRTEFCFSSMKRCINYPNFPLFFSLFFLLLSTYEKHVCKVRIFQWQRHKGNTERQQPTCETSASHNHLSHTLSTETRLSSLLLRITLKGSTLQKNNLQNFSIFQTKCIQETLTATGQTQVFFLFTSVVNKKKTFNKIFKFYTVSDTSRKEIQLPVLYKKLYEISRQGISQAYHLIWYVTIWSFYLKNIFNNILSSNVLQILVIKVFHCYFLYSPEFPTYLLLCRFLFIQTERT